jgi:FkbM family methyltransferase
MRNLFRKIITRYVLPHSRSVYAQSGEDLILSHIFFKSGIQKPSYLDIGANHPSFISNTYYFYLRGSTGVCVEPNPYLYKKIMKARPRDQVINAGIGVTESAGADFYLFPDSAHGLSTFSRKDAEYWGGVGMKNVGRIPYEKVIKIPLVTINSVIEKYYDHCPDFISLDVEGLDLDILQSLDYNRHSPKVICVETLLYDDDQQERKNVMIIDFLKGKGYEVYADTHVNTIFTKF